jgi:hypothetical protein
LKFTPYNPIDFVEHLVAVAHPEIGTPPIQDRIELPDYHVEPIGTSE